MSSEPLIRFESVLKLPKPTSRPRFSKITESNGKEKVYHWSTKGVFLLEDSSLKETTFPYNVRGPNQVFHTYQLPKTKKWYK